MRPYIWIALLLWAIALGSLYGFISGDTGTGTPTIAPQVIEPANAEGAME